MGPSPRETAFPGLPLLCYLWSYLFTFHNKHVLVRTPSRVPPLAGRKPSRAGTAFSAWRRQQPRMRRQLRHQDLAAFPVAKPHCELCWAPGCASDSLPTAVHLSIPGGNRLFTSTGRNRSFIEHYSMYWRMVSTPGLRAQCQGPLPGIGISQNVILPSRGTEVPRHPHHTSCKPPD